MLPLKDEIKSYSFPFISYLIIILNIIVYIYHYFIYPDPEEFIYKYGFIPSQFDFFKIITSMFLHGGFFHIFSNMLFLFIFGDNVEDVLGHFRFLFFYIFWGICAAILQMLLSLNPDVPMIGASGAISGILGAYLVFFPNSRILSLVFIPFIYIGLAQIPSLIYLGFWFLNQFLSGTFSMFAGISGGIAFWAHIGGFVAGVITAIIYLPFKLRYLRRKRGL